MLPTTLLLPAANNQRLAAIPRLKIPAVRGAKKARRWSDPDRRAIRKPIRALEYAEYDGADKGKRDIRGHNAQPGDEGTKGHLETSQVPNLPIHVAACLNELS